MSFDELKELLIFLGLDEELILPEATREEAGLDSLAIAELALQLRKQHGMRVSETELHRATSLADVTVLVNAGKADTR